MTPRNFVYLAIAAVLTAVLAVVSYASHNQWSTGEVGGEKLLPALASQASQIATIEIRKGDGTVTLKRSGGSWGLGNRSGYPVDPAKVRTLLVGLVEADLIEAQKSGRSIVYRLKMSVLEEALLGFAHTVGWDVKPRRSTTAAGQSLKHPRPAKGEI